MKRICKVILVITSFSSCYHLEHGNGIERERAVYLFLREYASVQNEVHKSQDSYDKSMSPKGASKAWQRVAASFANSAKYGYNCEFSISKDIFYVRCNAEYYSLFGGLSTYVDQEGVVRYSLKELAGRESAIMKDL